MEIEQLEVGDYILFEHALTDEMVIGIVVDKDADWQNFIEVQALNDDYTQLTSMWTRVGTEEVMLYKLSN